MERLVLRAPSSGDEAELLGLIRAHARFEKSAAAVSVDGLRAMISGFPGAPSLIVAGRAGRLIGYASLTIDFSTWSGRPFGHLDCLYVEAASRGGGVGEKLFDAARNEARERGLARLEWQTPDWNRGARRFYRRLGAASAPKHRFSLDLRPMSGAGPREKP